MDRMRGYGAVAALGFALTIAMAGTANAEPKGPSAKQVKKDLKGKGVVKVDVRKRGAGAFKSGGKWVFEQTVEITKKTEWKGVKKVIRGDVVYDRVGSKWKYRRMRHGGTHFIGLDPPTQADLEAAIKAAGGYTGMFREFYLKQWTKIRSVKIAKDPKWSWPSPTSVGFAVVVDFEYKSSYTEVSRVEQPFTVSMERTGIKDSWTSSCKTEKGCVGASGAGQQGKPVLVKKYASQAELDKVKSVYDREIKKWAATKYATLGGPATFTSAKQVAQWAYKALRTGDLKSWQAFVIVTGDHWDAYENGRKRFIDNAVDFERQFCPEIVISETAPSGSETIFKFQDKAKAKTCQIVVSKKKPFDLQNVKCWMASGDEADKIAAVPHAEACEGQAEPAKKEAKPSAFRVGDKIMGKYKSRSKEYPGTVGKIDGDRIFVKYDDGDEEWLPASKVRKR